MLQALKARVGGRTFGAPESTPIEPIRSPSQRHRSLAFAVVAGLAIPAAGCQTMSDVVKAKDEGTMRVYPVSCDVAFDIGRNIFRQEGAEAIEEHRSEGYMLTSSSMGAFTYGTLMGAWFDRAKRGGCAVTVVTKRKLATGAVTTLTEGTFHDRFAAAVARKTSSSPR